MNTLNTDVVIIGAGPAGTAAASILRKQGFEVIIIEKTKFPRFVIGESLLPRCMDLLDEADLIAPIKAYGFQEKQGARFVMDDKICDFNFENQHTEGWKWTWQVTRADFDKVLADEVEKRGVIIKYETSVNGVDFKKDSVVTKVSCSEIISSIESKYIIDCSGFGKVLPNLLDLNIPSPQPTRSAFFTHADDNNRSNEAVDKLIQAIVIKQDVWAWLIPFSNGKTSIGVVGDLSFIDKKKSNEENFIDFVNSNPLLKKRFGNSKFNFEPKQITAYSSKTKSFYGDKFVLAGNSTEFLDPIFSSGVTFALESGVLAAKLVARQLKGENIDWEKEYVSVLQSGIDVFRSYVDYWYDGTLHSIFFSDNINPKIKSQICSVLAGYVWDETNPFVKKHKRTVKTLAKVIELDKQD